MSTSTLHVEFYRSWSAFPHTRDRADDIVVSVAPNGQNQPGNYEFSIEHTGSEKGRREPIALRVQLFCDSWRAFRDLPEFFDLLADLDESTSAGRSKLSLADLIPSLEAMGWHDKTATYADQHTHVVGCLTCGERLLTPSTPERATREGRAK
jgi:hypothetical protein